MLGQQSITAKARRRRRDGNESPELQVSRLGDADVVDDEVEGLLNGHAGPSKKNVDDLLPIGVRVALPTPFCAVADFVFSGYQLPHRPSDGLARHRHRGKNGLTLSMSTKSS